MAIDFPSEVVGTAVGVLVYSFLALALNGLVIWLTWVHRERISCQYSSSPKFPQASGD